jgi:hypothetical protein
VNKIKLKNSLGASDMDPQNILNRFLERVVVKNLKGRGRFFNKRNVSSE